MRDGQGDRKSRTRLDPGQGATTRRSKTLAAAGREPRDHRDPQATSNPTMQFGAPLYLDSDRRIKVKYDGRYMTLQGDTLTLNIDALREALGL